MITCLPLLSLFTLSSLFVPVGLAAEPDPTIPFETYTLDNGLVVVLAKDDSIPFVQVHVRYAVGSKDEQPGKSGFAHLFEHMMFQGSAHADDDYFAPFLPLGGQLNGNTTLDRTVYFEGVPSNYLAFALFHESDRMGWLLPAMTADKFKNQQDVVRNERRQRYETPPYGEAWPKLLDSVWPDGHPYHIATIGKHEDLSAASLDDVQAFFRTWYLPNNATLTVCGDFDPAEAKALVQTYFGDVPAGPEPKVTTAAPVTLTGTRVVKVEKPTVPFPKVWVAWISPAAFAEGDADLDLAASILSNGEDSPLYKRLVRDSRIAQSVNVSQNSQILGGMFIIEATAATGHTADELVAAIDDVLANVRKAGVSSEDLDIARTAYEVGFYGALQSIAGKADLLSQYQGLTGDAGYLSKDIARYRAASVDSVNAALRRWAPAEDRVVLQFLPSPVAPSPATPSTKESK